MQQFYKYPLPFWIIVSVFLIHQTLQKVFHFSIPFFDSYLDPFCAAILLLCVIELERKILWRVENFSFKVYEVLITLITFGIVSEEVFPSLSDRFTSDIFDYFAIGLGGLYYWILIRKK